LRLLPWCLIGRMTELFASATEARGRAF
jgi:hypothetical protein